MDTHLSTSSEHFTVLKWSLVLHPFRPDRFMAFLSLQTRYSCILDLQAFANDHLCSHNIVLGDVATGVNVSLAKDDQVNGNEILCTMGKSDGYNLSQRERGYQTSEVYSRTSNIPKDCFLYSDDLSVSIWTSLTSKK